MNKVLIVYSDAGLASRLKTLLSAMTMSNKYYIYWPKNGYSSSSFSRMFENNIEVFKFPFLNIFYKNFKIFIKPRLHSSPFLYIKDSFNLDTSFSLPLYDDKKGFWYRINDGKSIDYMYDKIPDNIKDIYIQNIRKIKFNKNIIKICNNFVNRYLGSDAIGLQIRTWIDDPRRKNMFNLKIYKDIIKNIPEHKIIYITTDFPSVIDDLRKSSKNKIITFSETIKKFTIEKRTVGKYQADDDFYALIELLILSNCKIIYGSYISNFPELAWWLSECKSEVRIVNIPSMDKKEEIRNIV